MEKGSNPETEQTPSSREKIIAGITQIETVATGIFFKNYNYRAVFGNLPTSDDFLNAFRSTFKDFLDEQEIELQGRITIESNGYGFTEGYPSVAVFLNNKKDIDNISPLLSSK